MPFLMKALAAAMREYPQFNASLAPDAQKLILKKYLRHLKDAYPYLYSLAMRQNPFDPEACVTVT